MPLDVTNWPQTTGTEADEATRLLIRARALVARGWCRGARARNFLGWPVDPSSDWAVKWCASGALRVADVGFPMSVRHLARIRLIAAVGGESLASFNDRQKTVEPVLAAFDRAIGACG